ncbi:MAG: hypothetical protein JWR48_3421 [Mycobacterium sp.]|nr:hypothetical protein [Mycobacterium sp.]
MPVWPRRRSDPTLRGKYYCVTGDRSDARSVRLDYFPSPVDFALVGPKCGIDHRYLPGMDGGLSGESFGNGASGRVLKPDIVADIEER